MKRLVFIFSILFLPLPTSASWNYDLKVGECLNTKVENITARWGENFYKYGLSMITIHNEKYCKKLLFLLENQIHPDQFHKKKQETFFVLFGKVKLFLKEKNKKIIKN